MRDTESNSDVPGSFVTPSAAGRREWKLIRKVRLISKPLNILAILFGVVSLYGYFNHIEFLYHPLPDGAPINPLTALSVLLLGIGLAFGREPYGPIPQVVLTSAALIITGLRLVDGAYGTSLTDTITPFMDLVASEAKTAPDTQMGLNTATMLFLIALAAGASAFRKAQTAQTIAFLSLGFALISYAGYAYGLDGFYGQMPFLSATCGIALSLSTLSYTAHIGALRVLLSPYLGGHIARLQITAGLIFPFLLGFVIVKFMMEGGDNRLAAGLVVGAAWFVISLVSISAMTQERVDYKRRVAERQQAFDATIDPLTRLPNRRKFFEVCHHEFDNVRHVRNDIWLLMIDLDHFKIVNDIAGHIVGDNVLVEIAQAISSTVRTVDFVGHLGGEAFAVLLRNTTDCGAHNIAEKIRRNIEVTPVCSWTDTYGPITTSIGCAGLKGNKTLEDALTSAEQALFAAKKRGRNRVVMFPSGGKDNPPTSLSH